MIVTKWTGVEVRALRTYALRCTQPALAEMTGFSVAVVRKWEGRGSTITLAGEFAEAMDTLLARLEEHQLARFQAALSAQPLLSRRSDEVIAAVVSRLQELRRVLDSADLPDDGPVRPADQLRRAVGIAIHDRVNSNYVHLACELPALLTDLHRARFMCTGSAAAEIASLLVHAYRAADAIADKFGYLDLSARIIGMMHHAATESDDDLLVATAAYVRTETFFANGQLAIGRRLLERAAEAIDPTRSERDAATYGSIHMRAAVVAAREFRSDVARAHLNEAAQVARRVTENVYLGTVFGPGSVRIHELSLGVELGDVGAAISAARSWAPPEKIPAERRSHFYIDAARAYMQTRQRDDARAALRMAEAVAPQHTHAHPYVKEMVERLSC